jgi:hypothetical protein
MVSGWATEKRGGAITRTHLFVTAAVDAPKTYTAVPTGIQCVTAPCQYWDVYDAQGARVGPAAEVNFRVMQLAKAQEGELEAAVALGHEVRGWYLPGSWQPNETGAVLYVSQFYVDP